MPREPQAPRRKSPCNTEHRSVAAKENPWYHGWRVKELKPKDRGAAAHAASVAARSSWCTEPTTFGKLRS